MAGDAAKVLLLDEPTRGIDVHAKREIYALLDELTADGLAVIMVSSELPEILAVADRILVLCEGRQTGEFSRAEASSEASCGPRCPGERRRHETDRRNLKEWRRVSNP